MKIPERRYPQNINFVFDRLTRRYDTTPEPLPKILVKFLKDHKVYGQVSEKMLYPIKPQIIEDPTEFSLPKYRNPHAEIDITPEDGPLPRAHTHFCLNPDGNDWFYIIALFYNTSIPDKEKIEKILVRLNEKTPS